MKRNRYKLVRRGLKWVVRAKLSVESMTQAPTWTGPYKTKYVGVHIPELWEGRYLAKLRDWDYDFWFHTKGEAIMFMLKCEV
jgi:hypothetical protein